MLRLNAAYSLTRLVQSAQNALMQFFFPNNEQIWVLQRICGIASFARWVFLPLDRVESESCVGPTHTAMAMQTAFVCSPVYRCWSLWTHGGYNGGWHSVWEGTIQFFKVQIAWWSTSTFFVMPPPSLCPETCLGTCFYRYPLRLHALYIEFAG